MKRTIVGVVLALAFVGGYYALLNYVNAKYGVADNTPKPTDTANQSTPNVTPTTGPTGSGGAATQISAGLQIISTPGSAADIHKLGSAELKNPQYALELRTTAVGASVDSVVLNDFLRAVDEKDKTPYVFQQAAPAVFERFGNSLATRSITVNGQTIDVSKAVWTLERQDGDSVAYALTLGMPGSPVLKVLKRYQVYERASTEHPGAGFEVRLEYDFENHSGRPLIVSMGYNGPALPPRDLNSGPDQRVMAGFSQGTGITVENHYVETFSEEDATRDLAINEDKLPMYWAGGSSVYFQSLMMPPTLATAQGKSSSTRSFKGIGLNSDLHETQPVALAVETTDLAIAANQKLNYPILVYFGPKWREVLNQPFYAQLPRHYDQTLVVRAGPCAVCTFDWLINLLVLLLGAFHTVARDWGLAIICLVILVRLALHPITKRSQVSMMKMGKMGPEMERLKKKYADDKEALQKAMWEFQKQQGITPILGCLPMFLQMPIWIALWSALNTTFELRHSNFLWGWTWINDLAKPDRLIPFPESWHFRIPLLGTYVDALNLLPILLAVVFYFQQKYTPKPATMTPEQAQQQKIMQMMMIFLFPIFLYAQPSGLNLYIMTSTAIGIWESKRIRKHIQEKEEAEKAGIVIVDAEPAPATGGSGKRRKKEPMPIGGKTAAKKPEPTSWLARKLAELQAKAEQARQQNERSRRDRA